MKIFAVEDNYLHNNNISHDDIIKVDSPVIFLKADSSLLKDNKPFFIPDNLGSIEYEAELVVRINKLGKTIPERFSPRYYDAVTLGVDFTARELHEKLKSKGLPWELSKSFDGATVIGEWIPKDKFLDVQRLHFHLDVNGKTIYEGSTNEMLYKIDALISYISRYFTLKTGDILFTGSPSTGRVAIINDHLEGYIEDSKVLDFNCK